MSLAMAVHDASCTVCGDGNIQGSESCDDGAANSDEDGAACRLNCRLPGQAPAGGAGGEAAAGGWVKLIEDGRITGSSASAGAVRFREKTDRGLRGLT